MKKAYLFSGQGSQYIGMEKIFKDNKNISEYFFTKAQEILGYDILDIISNGQNETLNNTKHTQPAIFLISAIAYNIYKEKHSLPDCCAGHSLGEITALYASEVLSFNDALRFIKKRAESMEKAGQINPGKMLAIIKPKELIVKELLEKIDHLTIANYNSKNQIILSGDVESINEAASFCKKNKMRALLLPVSGAFHSPLMKPASDVLLKTINELNFDNAIMPIYQNVNALPDTNKDTIKMNLIKQITSPVQWKNTINNMISDGVSRFIELGPKNILSNMSKKLHENTSFDSYEELIENESI